MTCWTLLILDATVCVCVVLCLSVGGCVCFYVMRCVGVMWEMIFGPLNPPFPILIVWPSFRGGGGLGLAEAFSQNIQLNFQNLQWLTHPQPCNSVSAHSAHTHTHTQTCRHLALHQVVEGREQHTTPSERAKPVVLSWTQTCDLMIMGLMLKQNATVNVKSCISDWALCWWN